MPQMEPGPWFFVLTLAWLTLLIMIPVVIVAYTYPDEPWKKNKKKPAKNPWQWPWL